ncbi:predicted protein [Chaetomium globosum CBS 148.51]|uniref:Uncharacterized protein n=1 Tax=Chaetomium globosum (strain ATCC 6205 / CBS 148.51 / DSM 1962 / NBRC 6347 / NRRL 1970) TaxID=306901 RepID=Q2H0M1_CHAGB|nr:uncharacterized protein CHGG_04675 [Chaetomium globosum CBS 148.51]EAQ88056.1 predicted protein [Chaetomium globosum CBS 148.51]
MSSLTPQFSFLTLSVQIREEAAQNAENWALCAMAIYLQKTFHLDSSPVPAASSANIQGSRLHEGRLAAPPAAWNRPVPFNSSTFNPDINGVIMLQKVGSLTSGPGKTSANCAKSSTNASWVCSDCTPSNHVCVGGSYP